MAKITLDCPKCGGTLEITEDVELFRCAYCSTPYLVERSAGAVQLTEIERRVDTLETAQREMRQGLAAVEELKQMPGRRERLQKEGLRLAAVERRRRGSAIGIGCLIAVGVGFALAALGVWLLNLPQYENRQETLSPIFLILSLVLTAGAWVLVAWLISRAGQRQRAQQRQAHEAQVAAMEEWEAELKRRVERMRAVK